MKTIVLDCETYSNYFLVSFMDIETEKVRCYELYDGQAFNKREVNKILTDYLTIGFNSNSYDLILLASALSGFDNASLKRLSDRIIKSKLPAWRVAKDANIKVPPNWDHVDVIEVAPGQASLKIYGGRLNAKTLQDLPYEPDDLIGEAEREQLRAYCVNDLRLTADLYKELKGKIKLREVMSIEYGMDLRSKSDAQIAETIIKSELKKLTGKDYRPADLDDDHAFKYQNPKILSFESKTLNDMYDRILNERFSLGANGSVVMPKWLRESRIVVAGKEYQMGIGGLHSCETRQYVKAKKGYILEDRDVASYYPNIILQQQLAPESLGEPFLKVYRSLVSRRLKAKKRAAEIEGEIKQLEFEKISALKSELAYQKSQADTLKISVNGSFGKLGSKYSALYAPELLIQTTVTGQLALLMLIERLTNIGVEVMSANTDGVVLYYPESLSDAVEDVCFNWQLDTTYVLEATRYACIASRDVNNYVAVGINGKIKGKGIFADPSLGKNPDMAIIPKAVALQIAQGIDYRTTIRECDDICQFVSLRRVTGGAVWRDEPLGKTVRFYISNQVPQTESISYKTNSNRVPKSAGARPLMTIPDAFPKDVDYQYYETEAEKLLAEVGYL